MSKFLAISVLAMLCVSAFSADVLMIDDFEYADAAAARQAWKIAEKSEPVELMPRELDGGTTALLIPCNFARDQYAESVNRPRAVYDRAVDLDLSAYGTIIFDFYAEDTKPLGNGTIYFHSAAGWYGNGFPIARGWNRVELPRGAFSREDDPSGWSEIDGVRICVWQAAEANTVCAIDNLHARTEDIAIIRGTPEGGEGNTAQDCAERVGEWLGEMGVPYGMLTDEDVEAGILKSQKLAIFAYNPSLSEEAVAGAIEFIKGGGKVMAFYSLPAELARWLGVDSYAYKGRDYDTQFDSVVFEKGAIEGLPEIMQQDSWNINEPVMGDYNARVIGYWQDAEGTRGAPAVVLSDNGAYMGHILTAADADNKRLFMISMVGHFVPEAWKLAADNALTGATKIGPFSDRKALEEHLAQFTAGGSAAADEVQGNLDAAQAAGKLAAQYSEEGKYLEVIQQAAKLRSALADAYIYAHQSRDGEFRAVWNHSGTGDMGSWDDAMKALSEANFNAVVPNMWWAGIAHYDSKILPHSKTFEDKGDQIAQAVEAGKKYGVQVHPWKVNWNLSTAPDSFVDKLREEGRLQAKSNGEEMRWLCPSHPENFKLEYETMLEVVRNYDVDGVHFDYIRYPHGDSCYCDGCHERFEKDLGRAVEDWPNDCYSGDLRKEYRQWRQDQITRLVKAVAEEAHRIKPHIKISAAVFGSYPGIKDSIGQDWVLWCKEGWLDFVCPMDYTQSDDAFNGLVSRQVGFVGGTVPLYAGIGHWRVTDDQAIGQMEISRALGADGFILFNMGRALGETGMPKFAKAVTSEKAVLPHDAPRVIFATQADNEDPIVSLTGASVRMDVNVSATGNFREDVKSVRGEIVIEDLEGKQLDKLTALPGAGEKCTVTLSKREGAFRVSAVGEMVFENGKTQRFIRRSRPYQFSGE